MAGSSEPESQPLDTIIGVTTPEGLRFDLHPAGPYARSLAFLIDLSIQAVFFLLMGLVTVMVGASLFTAGQWIIFLIVFTIQWFYGAFFEAFWSGQTPGKKLLGLQVVRLDGAPIDFSSAFLRNLLRAADAFLFSFVFGILVMILSGMNRRLGDLAAGAVVIYRPKAVGTLHTFHFPADLTPTPLPCPVDGPAVQALLAFASRFDDFSPARAGDLAVTALKSLGEPRTGDPARQLLAHCAWLVGLRRAQAPSAAFPKDEP